MQNLIPWAPLLVIFGAAAYPGDTIPADWEDEQVLERGRLEAWTVGSTATGAGFQRRAAWTARGGDPIDMPGRIESLDRLPPLPRLGVVMHVDGALENLRWYGRGPHENDCDPTTGGTKP